MTAEPDLLPLPSGNVAHATAARDAEIEALLDLKVRNWRHPATAGQLTWRV